MNAVISGASQGIGKAIAYKLAAEGFNLALCSRNLEKLQDLKSALENQFDINVLIQSVDVRNTDDLKAFASKCLSELKQIDILVNNAGTFIPGSIHNEEEGNMKMMMETNLYSAYHLTRAFTDSMMKNKSGHIFNMCSIASQMAYDNGGSYSISKFALLGFSKCLREEMKPHNVRVTQIMPGATRTPSWDGIDLPDERFIPAEDIAEILWSTYQLSKRTNVEDIVVRPQLGDI